MESLNVFKSNAIIVSLYVAGRNIGFDGSGTHNKGTDNTHKHKFLLDKKIFIKKIKIEENVEVLKFIKNFYRIKKIKNFFNSLTKRLTNFFE